MSDKQHTILKSRYSSGESVLFVADRCNNITVEAYVRAIVFTNAKIRYSIYLKNNKTTIHNVDSSFIVDSDSKDRLDFGMDNYS